MKSVVLCERARVCLCVMRYKDQSVLLSFLLISEKNNKKCAVNVLVSVSCSFFDFLVCFFFSSFLLLFSLFSLSLLYCFIVYRRRTKTNEVKQKKKSEKKHSFF